MRTLAEPNLTTLSGQTARFLAGGEVPISTVNANGEVSITYKDFGVKLQFTPLVLDDKKIQMNIRPEVSEHRPVHRGRRSDLQYPQSGNDCPAQERPELRRRRPPQNDNRKIQNQFPWIGQLPVLGTLFRSSSYQKQESDLVVIVTPQLTRPSAPGEEPAERRSTRTHPEQRPGVLPAGKLEVTKDMIRKYEHGEGVNGPFGHILDLDKIRWSMPKK